MRVRSAAPLLLALVLALPALAAAEQVPLLDQVKGFFAKATDSISSAVASATQSISIPDPAASVAAGATAANSPTASGRTTSRRLNRTAAPPGAGRNRHAATSISGYSTSPARVNSAGASRALNAPPRTPPTDIQR